MKHARYQRVALCVDLDEYGLKKGDAATLVDHVSHPSGGEDGCVLEVFNAVGESLAVVTVKESDVRALQADQVLTVRHAAGVS